MAPVTDDLATRDWIEDLRDDGARRDAAVRDLHALLLRAALFEVNRRSRAFGNIRGEDLDDLAMQAADDALLALLRKLGDFRGESRFTTWAYKFAILEAGVRVRRRAWQDREVVLAAEHWTRFADRTVAPAVSAETSELVAGISEAIAQDLTTHQRSVLVALAIDGVPIDVLAERLDTTRGALYKTLHDARRKLRVSLETRGLSLPS